MATETFDFGDIVDVKGRKLSVYGRITSTFEENGVKKAQVHFEFPNNPMACEKCGIGILLSVDAGTGEIVCMRSGCGHGHGFTKKNEVILVADLINVSLKKREKMKKIVRDGIVKYIHKGVEDNVLDSVQRDTILEVLDRFLN